MSRSLPEILDGLPLAERTELSKEYAQWYNGLLQQYKKDFEISEDDDCNRSFETEDQVIMFFREALLWWYKNKPKLQSDVSPLDAIKTWTCLGQIRALKDKLEDTGVPIKSLKLNEHFDEKFLHIDADTDEAIGDIRDVIE